VPLYGATPQVLDVRDFQPSRLPDGAIWRIHALGDNALLIVSEDRREQRFVVGRDVLDECGKHS